MEVRPASAADLPAVLEIWKEMIEYHAPFDSLFVLAEDAEETFQKYLVNQLENDDTIVIVGVEGDEVIGFTMASVGAYPPVFAKTQHGSISDMAVRSEHRRKGCGQIMLDGLYQWFRNRGIDRVELRAVRRNEAAYSFWKKQGFSDYIHTLYKTL